MFRIAVVIPAHNAAATLEQTVRSVLVQTHQVSEIVVLDDGSTDATPDVAEALGPSVRCLRQPNQGVAVARNQGVAETTADWVAFLDADDTWKPTKLEQQIEALKQHPKTEWASCGYCQCDMRRGVKQLEHLLDDGPRIRVLDDALVTLGQRTIIHTDTMLFARSLFERIGGNDEGLAMGEDLDLWVRMAVAAPRMGYVNESLATYYCGRDHSFSQNWGRKRVSAAPLIRKLARDLEDAPAMSREGARKLVTRVLTGIFSTFLGNAPSSLCREYIREMRCAGFGPVPVWMQVCACLPLPCSQALRRANFAAMTVGQRFFAPAGMPGKEI